MSGCFFPSAVVNNSDRGEDVVLPLLRSASKDGPMYVEIEGNPFAESAVKFKSEVLEAMNGAIRRIPISFTTDWAQAPHPQYKMVLLFGVPTSLGGDRICEGERPTSVRQKQEVTLRLVFCSPVGLVADAEGYVKNAKSAQDPGFVEMVTIATQIGKTNDFTEDVNQISY